MASAREVERLLNGGPLVDPIPRLQSEKTGDALSILDGGPSRDQIPRLQSEKTSDALSILDGGPSRDLIPRLQSEKIGDALSILDGGPSRDQIPRLRSEKAGNVQSKPLSSTVAVGSSPEGLDISAIAPVGNLLGIGDTSNVDDSEQNECTVKIASLADVFVGNNTDTDLPPEIIQRIGDFDEKLKALFTRVSIIKESRPMSQGTVRADDNSFRNSLVAIEKSVKIMQESGKAVVSDLSLVKEKIKSLEERLDTTVPKVDQLLSSSSKASAEISKIDQAVTSSLKDVQSNFDDIAGKVSEVSRIDQESKELAAKVDSLSLSLKDIQGNFNDISVKVSENEDIRESLVMNIRNHKKLLKLCPNIQSPSMRQDQVQQVVLDERSHDVNVQADNSMVSLLAVNDRNHNNLSAPISAQTNQFPQEFPACSSPLYTFQASQDPATQARTSSSSRSSEDVEFSLLQRHIEGLIVSINTKVRVRIDSSSTDLLLKEAKDEDVPALERMCKELYTYLIDKYIKFPQHDPVIRERAVLVLDKANEWKNQVDVAFTNQEVFLINSNKNVTAEVFSFNGNGAQTVYDFLEDFERKFRGCASSEKADQLYRFYISEEMKLLTSSISKSYSDLRAWLVKQYGNHVSASECVIMPLESMVRPAQSDTQARAKYFMGIACAMEKLKRLSEKREIDSEMLYAHIYSQLFMKRLIDMLPPQDQGELVRELRRCGIQPRNVQGRYAFEKVQQYCSEEGHAMERQAAASKDAVAAQPSARAVAGITKGDDQEDEESSSEDDYSGDSNLSTQDEWEESEKPYENSFF